MSILNSKVHYNILISYRTLYIVTLELNMMD